METEDGLQIYSNTNNIDGINGHVFGARIRS